MYGKTYFDLEVIEGSLASIEQLLQVLIQIFEDKCEFAVSVQHIYESHDVWVLQLLEESNFADSRGWNSLVLRL